MRQGSPQKRRARFVLSKVAPQLSQERSSGGRATMGAGAALPWMASSVCYAFAAVAPEDLALVGQGRELT